MKIRKIITFTFVSAIVPIIAFMSGCERIEQIVQPVTQTEAHGEELTVGIVLPQTGVFGPSESGPGAQVMENGFNMALEEINRSQLHGNITLKFIIEDDRSTVEGAKEAFNKLIHQDRVPAILGVWTSQVAQFVFPIAQENQTVMLSPVTADPDLSAIGKFIFGANLTTDILVPSGIAVTQEKLGYKRVVTMFDNADSFSQSSDAALQKTFSDNNVEILTTETFASGDMDFSDQLTRIKALAPDAIFVSAQPIEVTEVLIQGRQLGIPFEIPFIVSLNLSIDEVQAAGSAAEGAIVFTSWISTTDTPKNQAFVQNYRMKYGTEPSVWGAQAYTVVYLLMEAIANAESTDSQAIATALSEIRDFDTVLGKFSFNANGDAIYDPVVLIVKNGKLEVFE